VQMAPVHSVPALRRVYSVGLDLGEAFHAAALTHLGVTSLPDIPPNVGVQIEEWQTHLVVRPTAPLSREASFTVYGRPWSTPERWQIFEKHVQYPTERTGRIAVLLHRRQLCVNLERPEPSTPELESVAQFAPSLWPMETMTILSLPLDASLHSGRHTESPFEPMLGEHYKAKDGPVQWLLFVRDLEREIGTS